MLQATVCVLAGKDQLDSVQPGEGPICMDHAILAAQPGVGEPSRVCGPHVRPGHILVLPAGHPCRLAAVDCSVRPPDRTQAAWKASGHVPRSRRQRRRGGGSTLILSAV